MYGPEYGQRPFDKTGNFGAKGLFALGKERMFGKEKVTFSGRIFFTPVEFTPSM
jgi:hypothetical protein